MSRLRSEDFLVVCGRKSQDDRQVVVVLFVLTRNLMGSVFIMVSVIEDLSEESLSSHQRAGRESRMVHLGFRIVKCCQFEQDDWVCDHSTSI